MAPWFETEATHILGTPVNKDIRELKPGQVVRLSTKIALMEIEIIDGDRARLSVFQQTLKAAIGPLGKDGVQILFKKELIPQSSTRTAEKESIFLQNGDRTLRVEWRPEETGKIDDSTAKLPGLGPSAGGHKGTTSRIF